MGATVDERVVAESELVAVLSAGPPVPGEHGKAPDSKSKKTKRRRRRSKAREREAEMMADPTPERLAKAGDAFTFGRGERGRKTVLTMRDSPLDRALARKKISRQQYEAGTKYQFHWFSSGMSPSLQSINLDSVFAATSDGSGMAKTEWMAHHRDLYRKAVAAIGAGNAEVLEAIVCLEQPMETVGYLLGWESRAAAIVAGTERMRSILDELVRHWRI